MTEATSRSGPLRSAAESHAMERPDDVAPFTWSTCARASGMSERVCERVRVQRGKMSAVGACHDKRSGVSRWGGWEGVDE